MSENPNYYRDFEEKYPWAKTFMKDIVGLNSIDIVHMLILLSKNKKSTTGAKQFFSYLASLMYYFHLMNNTTLSKKSDSASNKQDSSSKKKKSILSLLKPTYPKSLFPSRIGKKRGGGKQIDVLRWVDGKPNVVTIDEDDIQENDKPIAPPSVGENVVSTQTSGVVNTCKVLNGNLGNAIGFSNGVADKIEDLKKQALDIELKKLQKLLEKEALMLEEDSDDDSDAAIEKEIKKLKKQEKLKKAQLDLQAAEEKQKILNTFFLPLTTQAKIAMFTLLYGAVARIIVQVLAVLANNVTTRAIDSTGSFLYNVGSKAANTSKIIGEGSKVVGDLASVLDNTIGYVFYGYNMLFTNQHYNATSDTLPTINITSDDNSTDFTSHDAEFFSQDRRTIIEKVLLGFQDLLNSERIDLNVAVIVGIISFIYLYNSEARKLEIQKLALIHGNHQGKMVAAKIEEDEAASMNAVKKTLSGTIKATSVSAAVLSGQLVLGGILTANATSELLNARALPDNDQKYIESLNMDGNMDESSVSKRGGKRSRRRVSFKNKYVHRGTRRRNSNKK